ncbi:MAG: acetyl-CoA carboxylase biotin carboxylase subunit [Rhizobacter sp.]|nr:acetyl-CoA carboxylase biotin carboxylase subunit [Chlorobiales bacterium]
MKIRKVLVANRGEIAIRVMRTLREMHIESVAVFSDSDKSARFHRFADEAYSIGGTTSRESYLAQEKILDVARRSGCDSIHPGYGFLSENAAFATACQDAGLIFIGPKPGVITALGDKTEARKLAIRAGLPIAAGTENAIDDIAEAHRIADGIGYPVLVKAAAGGGGKGMKQVQRSAEFEKLFRSAQSEAQSAFGDGRVYIEKYLENPRHIEIQILCDAHGHAVYLHERECSIQRRHQKVIEEAPSSVLTPELRKEMGECAVRLAVEAGYTNAGTVEFLLDKHRKFYFLEVNTRLQVEHPVTEMITGLDLVREQIRIAEGAALSFSQADVEMRGHSIECRVYAEDAANDFLPSIGRLSHYVEPNGFGVRTDSAVAQGSEITMHFDPMISKLVVWDKTRAQAIEKMRRALAEYEIAGVETTIPFCLFAMQHAAFQSGNFDTHFIQNFYTSREVAPQSPDRIEAAAVLASLLASMGVPTKKTESAMTSSREPKLAPAAETNWERRKYV